MFNLIKVATNYMHIIRQCFQIVHGFLVAQIAGAEDVLYAAGHQQTFETLGKPIRSERYVKVTNH